MFKTVCKSVLGPSPCNGWSEEVGEDLDMCSESGSMTTVGKRFEEKKLSVQIQLVT